MNSGSFPNSLLPQFPVSLPAALLFFANVVSNPRHEEVKHERTEANSLRANQNNKNQTMLLAQPTTTRDNWGFLVRVRVLELLAETLFPRTVISTPSWSSAEVY